MKRKLKRVGVIAAVAAAPTLMLAQPASAESTDTGVQLGQSYVTVEQDGASTGISALAMSSNVDGGSPSASGCQTVTVNNEFESLLGSTLFWYHTTLHWCWNRAAGTISDTSTSWSVTNIAFNWSWDQEVFHNRGYYEWMSGYKHSGYKTDREGQLTGGCAAGIPCQSAHPHNVIRGHSDGTYSWFAN